MPVTRDTPWRTPLDVPYEFWRDTITSARNPNGTGERADPELASIAAWNMAQPLSALCLAMMKAESSYGTHFEANPRSNKNPLNLKLPQGGGYVSNLTWIGGIQSWRQRITSPTYKNGIYADTETIADLIHVFAPLSENDTEDYIDGVEERMNVYPVMVETPSTPEEPIPEEGEPMPNVYKRVPHPPFIDLPVSKPAGGGYGYTQIPAGSRKIVGVMNHETQGRGSGQWYRDFFSCPSGARCSDALVDYLITRDGTIYRYNNPRGNKSPWANGGPLGLEGDGPAFYSRFGASGVNNALISIEHESLNGENWTDAQVRSSGLLNAYWHDQDDQDWESYPYVPRYSCVTSLAHFEIGTTDCGKGELDDISRLQAVAKGEMKKWQTQADGPSVPEVPEVPDQPEVPTLPGGISVAEATKRFGTLTKHTPDGKTKVAPFDPKGVISLAWLHRCVETGEWPEAQDWFALSDSGKALDIITFSNDWQLIRTAERQAVMWARFADAELEDAA